MFLLAEDGLVVRGLKTLIVHTKLRHGFRRLTNALVDDAEHILDVVEEYFFLFLLLAALVRV